MQGCCFYNGISNLNFFKLLPLKLLAVRVEKKEMSKIVADMVSGSHVTLEMERQVKCNVL